MKALMKYSNSFMTLVMLAIFVTFLTIASGYPEGASFMPYVVGIPALLLLLVQLGLDARARSAGVVGDDGDPDSSAARLAGQMHYDLSHAALTETSEPVTPREKLRREAEMWGYFTGLIVSVLLFGFWITIPLFLIVFLKFKARASWLLALSLALPVSIGLYIVFEDVLRISPHKGFVTEYVLGLLS